MSARPSFVLDLNKCTGCHACAMSCQIANDLPVGRLWREVRTFNELHVPGVELSHLSLACNHCQDAPCMEQCPASAYYRDERTGAVLINADHCLGCRYCSWVCPYDAPRFDPSRGVMTKCTFCVEKQHVGEAPACVTSCPTDALSWGELDPEELVQDVAGFARAGIEPAIAITPLKSDRLMPEMTQPPALPPWQKLWGQIVPRITLAHEGPLAAFTVLMAVLVGALAGWRTGGIQLEGPVFLGLGAAGMALSASHLGRKERAWRAGLNLDKSWLSREIILIGAFVLCGGGVLLSDAAPDLLGWLTVGLGFLALAVIDRVYGVCVIRGSGRLHSAGVFLTGVMFATVFAGPVPVAAALGTAKLILYVRRMNNRANLGLSTGMAVAGLRIMSLIAGLAALSRGMVWPAAGLILIGELIDRAEYYVELEIPTPNSLLLDELAKRPEAGGWDIKKSTRSNNAEAQGGSR